MEEPRGVGGTQVKVSSWKDDWILPAGELRRSKDKYWNFGK